MSQHYCLAQMNIGRSVAPLDDPVMQGFMSQLDRFNELAEQSAGFVWRLQTDAGNATSIKAFDDPRIILNMSVWESVSALHDYVYRSDHIEVLRQRNTWFERSKQPILVLWWTKRTTLPSVEDGIRRLELLRSQGASPEAFDFAKHFPAPDARGSSDPAANPPQRVG